MANPYFTCVLDAWRDGTTLYGRMHYYRTDGQTVPYSDSNFPDPTMNLGGTTFTDTAFGNWVRSGINVGNVYTTTFSRTVSGTGSRTVTFTAGSGYRSDFAGTWSVEVGGFPGVTTPPEDLTVSAPYNVTTTGATFDVSVSSYGTPASASGRYIEAGILETSNYNGNKRAAIASNVNSATITVDNNSTQVTSLTISPNTEYYYGAYASNTQTSTMTVSGQFVTLPADPTVSVTNVDGYSATIYYSVSSDGGHYNRILEYSLDGSTWNAAVTISDGNAHTGTFTINNLQAHTSYTVRVRVKTDAGVSSQKSVYLTTKSMFYGAAKHFGNLQLKGDTTQQTYSGKNLFDFDSQGQSYAYRATLTKSSNSFTATNTVAGLAYVTLSYITFKPNTTYTVSYTKSGDFLKCLMFQGDYTVFGDESSSDTLTFTTTSSVYTLALGIYPAYGVDKSCTLSNIQIEEGSTATPYEPYVGGIPAPNPDYPQIVNTVTGRQVVEVYDKNLCNGISQGYWVSSAATGWGITTATTDSGLVIPVSLNTDYAISTTETQTRYRICFADNVYDANSGTGYNGVNLDGTSNSVTKNSGSHPYMIVNATDLSAIQVELGNQATPYQPHYNYEVNLGKNLFDGTYIAYAVGGTSGYQFFSSANARTAVVPCEPSTTYTISKNTSSNRFIIADYTSYPNTTTELNGLANQGGQTLTSMTVTTHSNAKYLFVYVSNDATEPQLQIEKGSTATSYAPYFTPIELCKIDTYQDYIYKSGNDWYVHKETNKADLALLSYTATYNILRRTTDLSDMKYVSSNTQVGAAIAEKYIIHQGSGMSSPTLNGYMAVDVNAFAVNVGTSDVSVIPSGMLYYALAAPTDTKITNADLVAQLNALYSAQTYGDNTVVTVTSANLGARFSADYITTKRVEKLYGGVNAIGDLHIAGDTTQQTYTGKNLLNVSSNYTISSIYSVIPIALPSGATYTLQVDNVSTDGSGDCYVTVRSNGSTVRDVYLSNSNKVFTFSLTNNADEMYIYADRSYAQSQGKTTTFTNLMVSKSPSVTTYEPYVGGIPAPNPDYPQEVQTVTGRQVVTISDGDQQSQSYEVNLGKNLLDSSAFVGAYINASGNVVSDSGNNNALFDYIPVDANSSYTASYNGSGTVQIQYAFFNSSKSFISRDVDYTTLTSRTVATPAGCAYVRVWFYRSPAWTQTIVNESKLQFEKGSTATTYAPYISHFGKNMWDPAKLVAGYGLYNYDGTTYSNSARSYLDYIEVRPSTAYTMSGANIMVICFYDSSKTYISGISTPSASVTTPANAAYVRISIDNTVDYSQAQFEQSSTATPYQQFIGGQLELCKIGDYQDYIYKSGDDWYVHKETNTVTLDGTEQWNGGTSSGSPTFLYAYSSILDSSSYYTDPLAYSSHFLVTSTKLVTGSVVTYPQMSVVTNSSDELYRLRLMIPLSITPTANDFKTWLGNNNVSVLYHLAVSQEIQITDANLVAQLDALHSATTYGDDTVVITASPYVPAQVTAIWISSREILKLYGSVSGQSKLVYKALS